jgi:hypothetical protein
MNSDPPHLPRHTAATLNGYAVAIAPWADVADHDLVDDLWVVMKAAPPTHDDEYAVALESRWEAGRSSVLVCLCEERPPGWPP